MQPLRLSYQVHVTTVHWWDIFYRGPLPPLWDSLWFLCSTQITQKCRWVNTQWRSPLWCKIRSNIKCFLLSPQTPNRVNLRYLSYAARSLIPWSKQPFFDSNMCPLLFSYPHPTETMQFCCGNDFSKVVKYKINMPKSATFLYNHNG